MTVKEEIETLLGLPVAVSGVEFCDYQCNSSFQLSKLKKKPATVIAEEIAEDFNKKSNESGTCIAAASACPPGFVNFVINNSVLEKIANDIITSDKLPLTTQKRRTVFFDYGGANVAKELHIGHLRSPIIGESLKRVFTVLGHKTISDPFFGDWGLQMGLVLAQLWDENFIKDGKFVKEVTLDTLNSLYPKANARSKTEPEFYAKAEQITADLQDKKQPYYDLWKVVRKVSVDKICENYRTLGCTFDTFSGESNSQPYVEKVLKKLKSHGAYLSDGCLVMDVKTGSDTAPMPPVILQKGNGGDLYATSDISAIFYRFKNYKPDEFVYIVDSRQEMHFKQVFRAAHKAEIVPAKTVFTNVSFGTMNGADGKPFKTRMGNAVKLEEIINLVTEAAAKRSSPENALKIGLAALKFSDLSNNVRKDFVFDIDKCTSFEGRTGPYLLYTVARINSILKKSRIKEGNIKITEENRRIIMNVIKLGDSFAVAANMYSLNGIVDAAYETAASFNMLYANTKIAGIPSHLALCSLVKTALIFALDTLAIQPVDEM